MQCLSCGTQNPAGSRFCKQCGESLSQDMPCPQCGHLNQPDSKFCMQCGQLLQGQAGSRKRTPKPASKPAPQSPTQKVAVHAQKRRGLPGTAWAVIGVSGGVLLMIMLCVLLLWFDVVNVPAAVLERLPEPLAQVAGQVVNAIEARKVFPPIVDAPAQQMPEDEQAGQENVPTDQEADEHAGKLCALLGAGEISFRAPAHGIAGKFGIKFPAEYYGDMVHIEPGDNDGELYFNIVLTEHEGDTLGVNVKCDAGMQSEDQGILNRRENGCGIYSPTEIYTFIEPWQTMDSYDWIASFDDWFLKLSTDTEFVQLQCTHTYTSAGLRDIYELNDLDYTFWDAGSNSLGITFSKGSPFDLAWYDVSICSGEDTCWDESACKVSTSNPNSYVCILSAFYDPDSDGKLAIMQVTTGCCDSWPVFYDVPYPSLSPCRIGETYHPEHPYNNGCCTNGCWCRMGGVLGCWNTCPNCPH